MKKLMAVVLLAGILSGCAKDNEYGKAYGLANEDSHKNPNATYEISMGSAIVGVILCETLIFPVYIVGWDLYEATGVKK